MEQSQNLLYGKRVGNKSIRVYQNEDDTYLVLIKKYYLGFALVKKSHTYDSYSKVEDLILEFKNQLPFDR